MNNRLLLAAAAATAAFAATSAPASASTFAFNFEFDTLEFDLFGDGVVDFDQNGLTGSFITEDADDITGNSFITAPFEELFDNGVITFPLPPGVTDIDGSNVVDVAGGGTVNGADFTTIWNDGVDDIQFTFLDIAAVEECTSIVCTLAGESTITLAGTLGGFAFEEDVVVTYDLTTTPVTSPVDAVPGGGEIAFSPDTIDDGTSVPEPAAMAGLVAIGGWMLKKRLGSKVEEAAPRFS